MEIQGHNHKLMKCSSSWVNLPPELLTTILDRLDISSSIRLAAVCASLAATIRTCLPATPPYRPDKPIPWLLLSAQKSKTGPNPNRTILTFYDLPTSTSYSVPTPIPSLNTHRWLSSKKGWLLTCDPQSRLHLIKPLTGTHILLPSKGIETKLRHKVTLCHTPDCASGFLVVGLIQHQALVFMKAGDKRWTTINASEKRSYEDVVVYQEKLYALTSESLCCWDIVDIGFSFKGETQISQVSNSNTCWLRQLMEWRGELLMMSMHKDQTSQVKLHRLNLRDPAHSHLLSPVQSIGDDALFIGTNYSFVVQTSGLNNVQGNCIYFTSDVCQSYYGAEEFHSKCAFRVFDRGQETYMPCSPPGSPVHLPLPICWFQPQ
ncbi:F-box family protein [Rhynchospora pubera]|uniref:F-box family protein n=1 Tax=Rhynchospora pubera TaxID=906938 RepID=A0AAV8FPU2_9POAL|nr:F-box family protein [Rhynchospora pubera]